MKLHPLLSDPRAGVFSRLSLDLSIGLRGQSLCGAGTLLHKDSVHSEADQGKAILQRLLGCLWGWLDDMQSGGLARTLTRLHDAPAGVSDDRAVRLSRDAVRTGHVVWADEGAVDSFRFQDLGGGVP